jgi:hypothetical protein
VQFLVVRNYRWGLGVGSMEAPGTFEKFEILNFGGKFSNWRSRVQQKFVKKTPLKTGNPRKSPKKNRNRLRNSKKAHLIFVLKHTEFLFHEIAPSCF